MRVLPFSVAAIALFSRLAYALPQVAPGSGDDVDSADETGDETGDDSSNDEGADIGAASVAPSAAAGGASATGSASGATPSSSAGFVPSEPSGNTVVNVGANLNIQWDADPEGIWNNVTIQLMTGSNMAMVPLTTVATGIDGTDDTVTSYSWQVPEVNPYSKIYFLQFNQAGQSAVWTTRFTIAAGDGSTTTPPNTEQDADGNTIGWGIGKLGAGGNSTTPSGAGAAAGGGAAAPAADSNGLTLYNSNLPTGMGATPTGISATGVAEATQGLSGGALSRFQAPVAAVFGAVAAAALLV